MDQTLFSLAEGIRQCTACPLWKGRTIAVPGEGTITAKIMVIGEAPGTQEDRLGLPFVGKSGKFLTTLFSEIGVDRSQLFITSCVKCHPPENRAPSSKELSTCKETWLLKQIDILKPKLIVLVGGVALSTLLSQKQLNQKSRNLCPSWLEVNAAVDFATPDFRKPVSEERRKSPPFMVGDSCSSGFSLSKVHGKVIEHAAQKYFITFHPSAALRFPLLQVAIRADFQKLKKIIATL